MQILILGIATLGASASLAMTKWVGIGVQGDKANGHKGEKE